VNCYFLDGRSEFVEALAQKLGADINLIPAMDLETERTGDCDVVVVQIPGREHPQFAAKMETLDRVLRRPANLAVVAFVSTSDRSVIREVLAAGAYDYFIETGSMEELRIVLRRAAQFHELQCELERLRAAGPQRGAFAAIFGTDPGLQAVLNRAARVADTDATILVTGESGTGKELLARAIHEASPRAREPFVAVTCSSLPESLIEAELFGHEKGAFTGANGARKGRFEAAERGTIFLDEVGDLAPGLQVKLLRVLQERTFERVGSNQARPMEARVICATNRDLKQLVKAGSFRLDLYYRLNTIEVALPPLRERRDDVILLAHTFLRSFAERYKRSARRMSPAVLRALQEHEWPGNVRELQNVMEHAVVVCDVPELRLEHLPSQFSEGHQDAGPVSLEEEVRNFKRRLIQRTLVEFGNNKVEAARSLKIARSSLHRLIEELQIPASPSSEGLPPARLGLPGKLLDS
jgi:DNA-binding NtrC family response regulator